MGKHVNDDRQVNSFKSYFGCEQCDIVSRKRDHTMYRKSVIVIYVCGALPVRNIQEVLTLVDDTIVTPPHKLPFNLQFCKLSVKMFVPHTVLYNNLNNVLL